MPTTRLPLITFWRIAPFTRLLLPLLAGILAGQYLGAGISFWNNALAISTLFFLLSSLLSFRRPILFGLAVSGWLFTLGGLLLLQKDSSLQPGFIGKQYQEGHLITATLLEDPVPKPRSWKSEARIALFDTTTQKWKPLQGKILLYFAKDSLNPPPPIGAQIAFTKSLQPIKNTGNPAGFDYARFSARKDIYYQVYLTGKEYVPSDSGGAEGLQKIMQNARKGLLHTLTKYIPDPKTRGLAAALLTGYRDDMDKELSLEYAGTGVAHIIAISGLHLGLIQGGLLLLLLPLTKLKQGKKIRGALVIVLLWIFALLTGGSPSVLRAALMFSLILLGDIIQRKGNGYNSLSASAFLLLLFNPNLLWDVGFQLSYAAVLSILVFYPAICQWFRWPRLWMHKIWQIMAVTLAAQILTLPIVLYYFQQFPVYFLLANMVAVPLSTLILYLLLLLGFMFWWWAPVAKVLGLVCSWLIGLMNQFIHWIHQLPLSRVEDIYLPLGDAFLLMGLILLIGIWLFHKRPAFFIAALAAGLLFFGQRFRQHSENQNRSELIVYHVPGNSAIDIMANNKYWFWGDSACQQPGMLRKLHLTPYRTQCQADSGGIVSVASGAFYQWAIGGKKLLILDKALDLQTLEPIETDILLIATNLRDKPEKILAKVRCQVVVADAKLPFYRLPQWQNAADSLHLRFHSVSRDGAFVLQLNNRAR